MISPAADDEPSSAGHEQCDSSSCYQDAFPRLHEKSLECRNVLLQGRTELPREPRKQRLTCLRGKFPGAAVALRPRELRIWNELLCT